MSFSKNMRIIAGALVLLAVLITLPRFLPIGVRHSLLQSPFVERLAPLYHSLRKLPDIVFMPYALMTRSELPLYEISISERNVARMNEALPDRPFSGNLFEENRTWVNADFQSGAHMSRVNVRYRGNLANHWNSYKRSYLLQFPRSSFFEGMREVSLIVPVDRSYFATSLANYRARKLGLLVPREWYARLSVNGSAPGVMLAKEHWSQEWLDSLPVPPESRLYSVDTALSQPGGEHSIYSEAGRAYWKRQDTNPVDDAPLDALIALVSYGTIEEFEALAPLILDLEAFYAGDTIRVLSGGYHLSNDGNNLILLFNAGTGRFQPVPYNVGLAENIAFHSLNAPLLEERIWSVPAFKEARDAYFAAYVRDNAEDDIAFIDAWIERMRGEFLRDHAKLENNFMFLRSLQTYRDAAVAHLSLPPSILDTAVGETPWGEGIRTAGMTRENFLH